MSRKRVTTIIIISILSIIFYSITGCSKISLFTLIESEQEGDLSIAFDTVNLKSGAEYVVTARGGFLPYSYRLASGYGSVDPEAGIYTAPANAAEEEIECIDRLGRVDTAVIRVYEPISADPASFYIRVDEQKSITVGGGSGKLTAWAELGTIGGNAEPVVVTETFTYNPPAVTGVDYIYITDELDNILTIRVEVLSSAADVTLELLPTYAVLSHSEVEVFDFINNTGHELTVDLSDDTFGTIDKTTVGGAVTTGTITYTAPATDGAVFLKLIDIVTSESVRVDIYVQEESTPLEISPSSVQVPVGTLVEFTASGGVPPYTFLRINGEGTLVQTSPTTAEYTPLSVVSKIRVIDAVESHAEVMIKTNVQ